MRGFMMSAYSLSHLSDQALLADLAALVAADRQTTAALLAHIAEVDARELYLPAACSSMLVYSVQVLHLAEDVAFKRIRAARAARKFPQIFDAIADGLLHLSGVVLLAPHLTPDNADELLAAAGHRSKAEIAVLLAQHCPRPDVPTRLEPLPAPAGLPLREVDLDPPPAAPPPVTKVTPLAPQRFVLQVTIDQAMQEKMMRLQALMRHEVPSGDLAQILDRALDALLAQQERRKFGATARPRTGKRRAAGTDPRYVSREVRRAVHARDGEQCTFVSEEGVRCSERGFLELDHRVPVALGGQPTVDNLRTMCAAHNRYEAERIFGTAFMQSRRARKKKAQPCTATVPTPAPAVTASADAGAPSEMEADAMLGLRGLGFTPGEARTALARSAHLPATTLEQRLRVALAELHRVRAHRCREEAARWHPSPTGFASSTRLATARG
jgi:5-methylcytosine-specific restriction endonuclease McrA